MSSSTSSSRPTLRQELKVLAVVACMLMGVELLMRRIESRVSAEYATISSFAERAERLASSQSPRILVIGDSLAEDGFRADVFSRQIEQLGHQVSVDAFTLPGSEMSEWYWLFRSYFADAQHRPDMVFLCSSDFVDYPTVGIGRLATLTRRSNHSELLLSDIPDFCDRAKFLKSSAFRSFAGRDRIQKSILSAIIPNYQEGRTWQHNMLRQASEATEYSEADNDLAQEQSYSRLHRFLDLADEHNVAVAIVLMPMAYKYDVDESLVKQLCARQVPLVDCRWVEEITPASFYDGVHLSSEGARTFSGHFAGRVVRQFLSDREPAPTF